MRLRFALPLSLAFVCGLYQAAPAVAAPKADQQVRSDLSALTGNLLEKRDFAALDRELVRLRVNRIRTPSGIWAYSDAMVGPLSYLLWLKQEAKSAAPAFAVLDKWEKASPKSTAVPVLRARIYLSVAFDHRGQEYAQLVKKEAWKPFYENVTKARTTLEKAKSFASVDPQWYGVMEHVANLESWSSEQFTALLMEAVSREPTYHFTYFDAIQYLSPKWGGSVQSLEEFAQWAEKAAGKDEGPAMYARIYWYALETQAISTPSVTLIGASWPKMRAGFDVVMAQYPDDWNLQNYAKFACFAGDEKKTRQLMRKIDIPLYSAWRGTPAGFYGKCRYTLAKIREDLPNEP